MASSSYEEQEDDSSSTRSIKLRHHFVGEQIKTQTLFLFFPQQNISNDMMIHKLQSDVMNSFW